jgi:hypothetical protein
MAPAGVPPESCRIVFVKVAGTALKIRFQQWSVGSTPTFGTSKKEARSTMLNVGH